MTEIAQVAARLVCPSCAGPMVAAERETWRLDQIVGVKDAARSLPKLIERHESIVLTRRGEPRAVLVPLSTYENGQMPIMFARDLLGRLRRLVEALDAEEQEDGFPFSFEAREALREARDVLAPSSHETIGRSDG